MSKQWRFLITILILFNMTSCFDNNRGNINDFKFTSNVINVGEKDYKLIVSNSVSVFDLNSLILDDGGCNYSFSSKTTGSRIKTEVNLAEGNNEFALKVGKISWNINVYRHHLYTISFDAGSSYSFNDIVVEEEDIINPPVVVRDGYTCSWDFDFSKPILSSFTTHIVFSANHYKIFLNADGGELDSSIIDVLYDESYSIPIPSKKGYEFVSWVDDNNITYSSGIFKVTHDLYLSANYNLKHYSIRYVLNDIEYSGNFTYSYTINDTVELPDISLRGYDFVGWQDQNSNIYNLFLPKGTIGDLVLTPIFDYGIYTVTFDLNGGYSSNVNEERNVYYNSFIDEPDVPCHKSMLFDGWYYGDKRWDFSVDRMPYENITLKARYFTPQTTNVNEFEYEYNSRIGYYYDIHGNYKTISGYLITKYLGSDACIRIPENIGDVSIVGLADQCFMNNSVLEQIYFDSTIRVLGKKSLAFCNSLTSVVFNTDEYYIDSQCFYKTNGIKNIYFANNAIFRRGSTHDDIAAAISTCLGIENILMDYPSTCGTDGSSHAALYGLKNLKNLFILSDTFVNMRQAGNGSRWIQECSTFNFHFNGTIEQFFFSLGNEPLCVDYYLYLKGGTPTDIVVNQNNVLYSSIPLTCCLNSFNSLTLNQFDKPGDLNKLTSKIKCVRYTNYQSQNFEITTKNWNLHFEPEYLFVPNNLSYLNVDLYNNESSIVIPNEIGTIDNCKGFKYVFVDKTADEVKNIDFGESIVYCKGNWHLEVNGLPVPNN